MRVLLIPTLAIIVGCATVRSTIRTINDIAGDACVLFASDHEHELEGLTPAEFCAIQDNLDPFIDHITAAQQSAGRVAVGRE